MHEIKLDLSPLKSYTTELYSDEALKAGLFQQGLVPAGELPTYKGDMMYKITEIREIVADRSKPTQEAIISYMSSSFTPSTVHRFDDVGPGRPLLTSQGSVVSVRTDDIHKTSELAVKICKALNRKKAR